MPLEEIPAIQDLDNFANSLPDEMKSKAYYLAKSFLNIGVSQGILKDKAEIEEYNNYFGIKEKEYSKNN